MGGGGWVAYRILVSSPVPFGLIGWNQVGLGWNWSWGDWELKGLGLELDKSLQKNTNGMTDTNQTFIVPKICIHWHCKVSNSCFIEFVFNIDIMD